jgi:hypothetical protein
MLYAVNVILVVILNDNIVHTPFERSTLQIQ